MNYREKLMAATDLLQRCSDGFGAFINGRKMARKERDALRRDIANFLDGSRVEGNSTMRDLLALARTEIYHNPECVPGQACKCENGELMRRIDAALDAQRCIEPRCTAMNERACLTGVGSNAGLYVMHGVTSG